MANRVELLERFLSTTHKVLEAARLLSWGKVQETDEDPPVFADLKELLADRDRIIGELEAQPVNVSGESNRLLAEISEINNQAGTFLAVRCQELSGLLHQLREGKKVVSYLKEQSENRGVVLDRLE